MCGTVSFKRGESFYRTNKVMIENYSEDHCVATVKGTEDFHVTIEKDSNGNLKSTCSCPKLASFQKECQHIAAVLLCISENQKTGNKLFHSDSDYMQNALTEGLLTLFNDQPIRSSRHQLHFETREVLTTAFTCKPYNIGKERYLLGIEMKIGITPVQNIRDFLQQVKSGNPCLLSMTFSYDPSLHCFQVETDDVLQMLYQVMHDEKVFLGALPEEMDVEISRNILLLPPSSWEQLLPLLIVAPMVKLEYNDDTYEGLKLSNEILPLKFDLIEHELNGYQLVTFGLSEIVVLDFYNIILFDGKLLPLKSEDCKRLSDLKGMLKNSKTNQINIPKEQIGRFIEKVIPGLKKLGIVQLSTSISDQLMNTPLIAKLFLDRVKNRLLAGLEFHYENMVINPLENRELRSGTTFVRDVDKEEAILQFMEESLFVKTDGGYYLHNEELEYKFLYNVVPKLQKLVQLYATTAVRSRIFRGNARPKIRVMVKKERTNWLEFKFEMEGIPDEHIREILQALEEKRRYYRLRNGSLLSLETREFEEIHRFLHAIPIQNEDLESGLSLPIVQGLQLLDSVQDSNVLTVEESFRQFLENIQNPGNLEFEVPKCVESILRDYQTRGYRWMKTLARYGFGGILADDMGLGKTLQAITFILSELPNIRSRKLPVLIVCPSSLTYNWLHELMKFTTDVKAVVMVGDKTERVAFQKEVLTMDVIITSYPLLRRDVKWFEKQPFHTVFFDEAQAFKNPVTQTARAVKKIQSDYRFALTGTPVENSLEELWSIYHVVFPELFRGLKEYSNLSRKTIARRISPFLLRRMKEDVLSELPEKIESIESVELLSDQKKLYGAYLAKLRHDTLKHLDKDTLRKNRIKILAGITRLRQICCHPALFVDGYKGSSAKFEQLLQILEGAKLSGRRVLIFSQFTKMLQIIGRELANQGKSFFYLDGQTPSEERVEICNRFNIGERELFLISLKAGGTGLNLTGADTVILYDNWWNPAVEEQAADRAHRMGQTNVVHVIKLVAKGTIEEKMNELQDKKRHLIEEIIHSEEKVSSALTEEDIRELLMI